MFRSPLRVKLSSLLKGSFFVAHCEEDVPPQAPEVKNKRVSTPPSYDSLKNTFGQANVPAYDGFRVIVQKQVNLNTVASHFYWIGSQATGQPIYQYRIILPFDEAVVNVASDVSMSNVEGEVRIPYNSNISSKISFNLGDQDQVTGDLELTDDSSNIQLQLSKGAESSVSMSYMQALTPNVTLGGMGTYSMKTSSISTGFAAILARDEHSLTAQWDSNWRILYMRKVNPNRVHLMTDLTIDEAGNSIMSCSAEYFLKQSKLHFGVDSNFQIKSLLETSLNKDMQLQLSADVNQIKNSYRFGFGLVISG